MRATSIITVSLASLTCLMLASLLSPASAQKQTVRVYVTNSGGDNIHVVDPASNKVVQQIKGIEAAHGIAFSPDGSRVYATNESDHTVDVFEQKTGKLIKKIALSGRPNNLAVAKDGRIVVAIAQEPGALDIIDPKTMTRKLSIPTNGRLHNTYVTPDSKYAISGSTRSNIFTVFDLQKEEKAWELNLGKGVRPNAIETNPDGSTKRIFTQLTDLNGFAPIDFATRSKGPNVVLPKDLDGIEIAAHRRTSPSHGIGVAPDNKTLWVTSIPANAVFVYSLPDLKLIGHAKLPEIKVPGRNAMGSVANWVTFTPDSKAIYISNAANNTVTAIDTQARQTLAVIPVGQAPKRIGTLVIN